MLYETDWVQVYQGLSANYNIGPEEVSRMTLHQVSGYARRQENETLPATPAGIKRAIEIAEKQREMLDGIQAG